MCDKLTYGFGVSPKQTMYCQNKVGVSLCNVWNSRGAKASKTRTDGGSGHGPTGATDMVQLTLRVNNPSLQ